MTKYVLIGYGCKRVFDAPDKYRAYALALIYAEEMQLQAWLLFDRRGRLVAQYPDDL